MSLDDKLILCFDILINMLSNDISKNQILKEYKSDKYISNVLRAFSEIEFNIEEAIEELNYLFLDITENYKDVEGLENSLRENGQYDLVIDFHRDSLDKKYSTLTYNQKSYAKILFVVGKSSGKFDMVNQLSTELSNRANEKVPGLSKGIMVKKNHYNQGICDHTILIEFGGQNNTKEEVQNTIEVMSQVIKEYLQ